MKRLGYLQQKKLHSKHHGFADNINSKTMRNKDKEDYNAALHCMEKLWGSKLGTAGGDELNAHKPY